jgi:predicted ATPase
VLPAVDIAADGRGQAVVLSGEPGMGKSRLAHEVLTRASSRGFRTVVGRCFEQYAAVPFLPISEVTADVLEAASPALRVQASESWPELGQLVPQLGTPAITLDVDNGQLRLFRAVAALLQAAAGEQPLALLVEDVHWADSATLGQLLYLGRHLERTSMLVIVTYRDADLGPRDVLDETMRELVREPDVDEVRLQGLSEPGSAALIRARLGTENVEDEFIGSVHACTGGNPFFIEELLKALVEQRALQMRAGRWEHLADTNVELQRSVRWVIGRRVGQLAAAAQDILRWASVLGAEFTLDMLLGVCGYGDTRCSNIWTPRCKQSCSSNAAEAARATRLLTP